MAIASVLDPRCKFYIIDICFPLIYKLEVAKDNVNKVSMSLEKLYNKYMALSIEKSSSNATDIGSNNCSSSSTPGSSIIFGFDYIMSLMLEKEAVPSMKSELDAYPKEGVYIP